jgi:hypothetical protein
MKPSPVLIAAGAAALGLLLLRSRAPVAVQSPGVINANGDLWQRAGAAGVLAGLNALLRPGDTPIATGSGAQAASYAATARADGYGVDANVNARDALLFRNAPTTDAAGNFWTAPVVVTDNPWAVSAL